MGSRRSTDFRMLKFSFVAVFGMLLVAPAYSDERKLMEKINKYNLLAQCWSNEFMIKWSVEIVKAMEYCGEMPSSNSLFAPVGNNQLDVLRGLLNNPAIAALLQQKSSNPWESLGKRKRSLGEPDEADKLEFMDDLMDFKTGMAAKIGNLSCVMTQMKMLDAAGNINMELYSLKTMQSWLKDTPAGSDPAFLKKLAEKYSDCYDISRTWPQKSLDRNPITKKHGRHMIFFECAKKVEDKMCALRQVSEWLMFMYGDYTKYDLGLPADKYDAAALAIKTLYSSATEEEKFVDDFFWSKSKL